MCAKMRSMDTNQYFAVPTDFDKAAFWLKYFQEWGCMICKATDRSKYGGCAMCETCMRFIDERYKALAQSKQS